MSKIVMKATAMQYKAVWKKKIDSLFVVLLRTWGQVVHFFL